tara:strand:- start:3390 stop:3506 length:117 start_codon:yes stop_codon:yes gene_type:complete
MSAARVIPEARDFIRAVNFEVSFLTIFNDPEEILATPF